MRKEKGEPVCSAGREIMGLRREMVGVAVGGSVFRQGKAAAY